MMIRSHFSNQGLHFTYAENGDGPPFVFQHGLGATFEQAFDHLSTIPNVRLISMDARAHGGSDVGPEAAVGFDAFANDLRALFDSLHLTEAITGGLSMGAGIALNFALRNPQLVNALVLVRPAWVDQPMDAREYYFAAAEAIREYGAKDGAAYFCASSMYRELAKQYPDMAKSLCSQFDSPRACDGVVRLERMPADVPDRHRETWKAIRCPTLVLAHGDDPVHPLECGQAIAASIPGAKFVEITPKSQSRELHETDIRTHVAAFLQQIAL